MVAPASCDASIEMRQPAGGGATPKRLPQHLMQPFLNAKSVSSQSPGQDDVFEVAHAVRLVDFGPHRRVRDWHHLPEHHPFPQEVAMPLALGQLRVVPAPG